VNLAKEEIFHISHGSLTCRKIVRHGTDGFTSPLNEDHQLGTGFFCT
jgi:hypothetical protein